MNGIPGGPAGQSEGAEVRADAPPDAADAPPDAADAPPDAVVVGAATRDIAADDPRGWRLGGAVAYAALTIARLGLRVAAILGADAEASAAAELDLLRDAGVDMVILPLRHGPIFENVETPTGRVQRCVQVSDPIPTSASQLLVGAGGRGPVARAAPLPRGWLLAPVADELPDAWADAISADAFVGLSWQGLLRSLSVGAVVAPRPPLPSRLLRRANLISVSRDDLQPSTRVADLVGLLAPSSTLVLTNGPRGGIVSEPPRQVGGGRAIRRYPIVPASAPIDPTGAGDVFLAALFAARLESRLIGGRLGKGFDLLLAAAAASLVLEGAGLLGVPTRSAVRDRMREGLRRSGGRG